MDLLNTATVKQYTEDLRADIIAALRSEADRLEEQCTTDRGIWMQGTSASKRLFTALHRIANDIKLGREE